MKLILFLVFAAVYLYIAYRVRGAALARFFKLDPEARTPAHELRDGMDFEPARTSYLLPQHFSAISAAGPIAGPIIAARLFGWFPAALWILVGSVLVGGVHDFTTLVASVRHKGHSIAEILRQYVNLRVYRLFLVFIWLALIYVIIAFTDITAGTFVQAASVADAAAPGPAVATSSMLYLALAVLMGLTMRLTGMNSHKAKLIFLPLVFLAIVAGPYIPFDIAPYLPSIRPQIAWDYILLGYCLVAALVPVWLLLQPRGDLGGYFLYLIMAAGVIGAVVGGLNGSLDIQAPLFTANIDFFRPFTSGGASAQPLFPMLFITIACGACSGFHAIVSGGTTSKQLDKEPDAVPVAYGGMLLEAFFACISLAAFMILATPEVNPNATYAKGLSQFINQSTFGLIPLTAALQFALLCFATFVFDTLDACTRLARFIIMELLDWKDMAGRIFATVVTVLVPLLYLSIPPAVIDGKEQPMWSAFWSLFGSSNQLLAALSLLVVSVWLARKNMNVWLTRLPAGFMIIMTLWSLGIMLWQYQAQVAAGKAILLNHAQAAVAGLLIVLAVWLVIEARRYIRDIKLAHSGDIDIDTLPYLTFTDRMSYKDIVINVRRRLNETVTVLYFQGDVFPEAVTDFAAKLKTALDSIDTRRVVLNLSQVNFVSSMAIGQLIALSKRLQAEQGMARICGLNPNLSRIFNLSGIDALFRAYPNEDEAVESFFS